MNRILKRILSRILKPIIDILVDEATKKLDGNKKSVSPNNPLRTVGDMEGDLSVREDVEKLY